ncbi:MAG: TetR/AcrR family transcriptional regulator [Chroococcidiopsidaceae cyanobacterium CP_BM_RX_35]|nr:TetR/AcrR family transcriptional regulator [Chroococcidiopsidaceae cyanobacterium CP_BM_RX_35]
MSNRETYHHGNLRQSLIEAALELVSEKDVESLSLREVARRVGVSHAAPYRHFADKEALLVAVAEEGFQMLRCQLETAVYQAPPAPLKQLQAIGMAYVQFALDHAAHYRVMFGAYGATSTQQHPVLAEAATQALMVLINSIIAGQQVGAIREKDPQQIAWAAWALVHGLAMLLMDNQIAMTDPQEITALSTFITQTLIEGLAQVVS